MVKYYQHVHRMFGQVCQNLICKGYLAHIVFFALNMQSSSFAGQTLQLQLLYFIYICS